MTASDDYFGTLTRADARASLQLEWQRGLEEIARKHRLTLTELRSPRRFKPHAEARRECYLYLQARDWSTTRIGKLFNRDHTTIVVALASEDRRKAKAAGAVIAAAKRKAKAAGAVIAAAKRKAVGL